MNPTSPVNIFIIDDNRAFALTLKGDIEYVFSNRPLKISIFETGEQSMEPFKEESPQVVILDYFLNSVEEDASDGIEVLDWIRKTNDKTYVIMLTSNDQIDIAIKSFRHGASDYVVKTVTQFKKIIFSLQNFFKIMEAENESKKYISELYHYYKNLEL